MADKHVHAEVENLSVEVKVLRDAPVDDPIPFDGVLLNFGRAHADSVPPRVEYCSNLEFQLAHRVIRCHRVSILDELQVELVEVCGNINALKLMVVVLVDEKEIRVDFEPAVFSQDDRHLILLAV